MEQVNTYVLFLLGKWMDSVFLTARQPLHRNLAAWQATQALLDILIGGDLKLRLNESRVAAITLRDIIREFLTVAQDNADYALTEGQLTTFNNAWGVFEQALALDLGRAPMFFVTDKGIFATASLIFKAEAHLVDDVREVVSPEALQDLNQAGRCLAFELSTAAGYHTLRATEKVLREYYQLGVPTTEQVAGVRMKTAIDQLGKHGGEKKTLAVLDQLRSLHRNPIDHPDVFLDFAEALELFNICMAAVSAMARQIKLLKS
jgi:hypothetical protein